jgi:hypothetical protein
MSWTTPTELRAQVQKLWDRGQLLASFAGSEESFPCRLTLKSPNSREIADRFADVRSWIAQLDSEAKFYRLEYRNINHRLHGNNQIPAEIWIDTLEDALGFISKHRQAEQFVKLVELTREHQPELLSWLRKRPLRALELADDWIRLLAVVSWIRKNPRPQIYMRQVDVPGVHSKFIEGYRTVLGELFDLVLPSELIDGTSTGISGFCQRYGFRDKPLMIRFRLLDPEIALFQTDTDQDVTLTRETFALMNLKAAKVFITENEINFLAFPPVPGGIVIFGRGYGFENLSTVNWLQQVPIYYWGDIDTHGFAILHQLRSILPQTISFLMDRETLLAHRAHWVIEPQPETKNLNQLHPAESALYEELCSNQLGDRIRLEQEKIGFTLLVEALRKLFEQ